MLYGKVIFIKKTGEDGSKFPVTSKNVKIGRSEDCVIRIQNPLVSPEQCQLIVDDDGQARIKNLSRTNPTILNDKPLAMGELVLRQGDIIKLGERLARWEYLPSSKYYHQQAHGSERLVAVIAPQKRISETSSTPNEIVKMKVTSKRRFSEKPLPTGRGSVSKILRLSLGSAKGVSNRTKLVPRHSLQLKNLTSSLQVKLRRSAAFESTGSPKIGSACKKNSRRSQTWEVNSLSPPEKSSLVSQTRTNRKSTPIKMPMTSNGIKSAVKSASKIPSLLTIAEFSPPPPPKVMMERMTVEEVAEHAILTSNKSLLNNIKTPSPKKIRLSSSVKSLTKSGKKNFSKTMELKEVEVQPEETTPSNRTLLRKSILKKTVSLSEALGDTPKKTPKSEHKKNFHVEISPLENIDVKSNKQTPVRPRKSTPKCVPLLPTSTPKYSEWSRGKKSIPSGILTTPKEKENAKGSPRTKAASSNKKPSTSAKKTPQKHGIKRKFSAVASAEMAAKKLKTIAPTKPDKNKKAALLVLGKASGKFRPVPNTNVVIKQKIVKKAIKQSTKRKRDASVKTKSKTPKRKSTKPSKTTLDSSPEFSSKTKKQSTPIKQSPKESSTRKSEGSKSTVDTVEKFKIESPQKRDKVPVLPLSESLPSPVPSKDNKNINFSSFQYHSSDILYNASRRASKRLNSQNFSQQEFTELSPTALGLAPRSVIEVFRTPRPIGRRSSSLVTPKNKETSGIVKSASTSKISRKSVRFSNKDSSFTDLSSNNGSGLDLSEIRTPDVTIDRFVSPMTDRKSSNSSCKTPSSMTKTLFKDLESPPKTPITKSPRSPKIPKLEVHKQDQKKDVESQTKESPPSKKVMKTPNSSSNKGNDASLSETGRRKSPRNDATDIKNVSRVLNTVKPAKSPKNDLTDVRGVKKLLATPKPHKSPKNDLTDVKGVKQLLASPKPQKSPKNDLTDVKGVKQLLASPKPQKSPKNDLTDVKGVKQLLASPKPQKSPKNDLTDVKGVKQLLASPKPQKSPKNDLTDVRGVKKLMASPRQQKTPKNDLTDVKGVKQLLASPKPQKSPKNDLTDVRGVKKLMASPRQQKTPKNDLTDVKGVKQLMASPKPQKSPKNDLTDVRGVRRLMESPKPRKSPRNDLTDVTGVKQLLITAEKDAALKSPSNKIQCLRTLYNAPKSPKNDLSDVAGVRELFSKNTVASNLDASLTGVAELFLSPKEDVSRKRMRDSDVDKKSTVRIGRSATKTSKLVEKKAKMTPQDPEGKSGDEQSPKIARAVRMRAAKTDRSPELKGTRTRFERDVNTKVEKITEEEQIATGRTTRAASRTGDRKQAVKKMGAPIESPTPMKTRKTVSVANETSEEFVWTAKTKKANFKEVTTTESKPSPIRTRRKSIARVSPKIPKRSTRANASKTTEDSGSNAPKSKSAAKIVVSPIKTRQRKAKEIAPKKETESKTSPVKTRRRAAK